MDDRKAVARLATVLLLTLPVANLLRDGTVDETLVIALLILAAGGGGGHAVDLVLRRPPAPDPDPQGGDDA